MSEQVNNESAAKTRRKVREGVVRSNKMDKTVVVAITVKKKDPNYGKYVKHTKTFFAHDEENNCNIGDTVKIVETRPLSKNKCWQVTEVLNRAIVD